jgi:hypothetical protein
MKIFFTLSEIKNSTQQILLPKIFSKNNKSLRLKTYAFFTNSDLRAIAPKPSILQSIL